MKVVGRRAKLLSEKAEAESISQSLMSSRNDAPQPPVSGLRRLLSRRNVVLSVLLVMIPLFTLWSAWLVLIATGSPEAEGQPKVDFLAYWTGSSLALDGEPSAAYDAQRVYEEQLKIHGDESGSYAWLYPPTFFFFVLPLGLLPVVPALVAWFAATAALAISAVRRFSKDTAVILLAVAFPATFWNFVTGQNGLLTAGLVGWGILLLRDRPLLAGTIFGLLAYKPQFFPLIPIALLAGGYRSAAVTAVASAATLSLASLVVFGLDSWEGFVSVAKDRSDLIYTVDGALERMQSVTGVLLLAGAPATLTQVAQAVIALMCGAFVVWLWRRPDVEMDYKAAGLTLAVLLATPYSYHYDLTLLGLVALWLGIRMQKEGWKAGDVEILTLAWLTPLLTLLTGAFLGLPIGPFVMILLLGILVQRLRSGSDADVSVGKMLSAAPV